MATAPTYIVPNNFHFLLKDELTRSGLLLTDHQNLMAVAEILFQQSFNKTLWGYRDDIGTIYPLLKDICDTGTEAIATSAGISRLTDLVYKEVILREFVSRLNITFKLSLTNIGDIHTSIIHDIATILTCDTRAEPNQRLTPDDITSRTHSFEVFSKILNNNHTLVTVILMVLWARLYSIEELRLLERASRHEPT